MYRFAFVFLTANVAHRFERSISFGLASNPTKRRTFSPAFHAATAGPHNLSIISCALIFHFSEHGVADLKQHLASAGIPMRIATGS